MKPCEYYEELIGAALDGEISTEENEELRAHLDTCESCRNFYDAMKAISGTDEQLPEAPEHFTENVMARVRQAAAPEEKPVKKKAGITRLATRYGALAAAAAVAIWAGVHFSGAFSAKNTESAAPEIAMYSATSEDAAVDAAPAESAGDDRMMAPAPESAAAKDTAASVTITAASRGAGGITFTDDGFFAGYLLLDEGETPAPEREPDYRLTLAGDGGAESEYELWIEEESIVWRVPDGGAAHLSPASPEALREYLDGVQE